MSLERLEARQSRVDTPYGQVLGTSYRWPGGQYCAIHTDRGLIGCGLYDCAVATRFGMIVAIARGTPEHPLVEPEDLLAASIAEVSGPAEAIGIVPGMSGEQALRHLLSPIGCHRQTGDPKSAGDG
jgi:uncharacterized protein YunC (DUF1805 family)